MFWGLILKANKKYTQKTKQAFHVSQAALDVTSCADGPIQLFLTYENIKYLICTLRKNTAEQVMLDLNFNEGDEISLQSQGSGTIHISGYVTDLSDQFDDLSEEESETEEQLVALKKSKNSKAVADSKTGKKGKAAEDEDDDDEDDSDVNGDLEGLESDSDDEEEEGAKGEDDDDEAEEEDDDDEEEDDDEDDEEEDESEDEEVQQPKAKQIKLDKPKQNGVEPQKKDNKQQKKNKKENVAVAPPQQKQKGGEQTLTGGVKVEDIRVGSGPEARTGKRAQVYYEGRLKTNNKVFDSLKNGTPFKFGLGRGEVIKGWDVGVVGMKVGGKRRITCPAHMAYGARGAPPSIPPNSTLVFEVELKGVN